jgi:hypothetical protein
LELTSLEAGGSARPSSNRISHLAFHADGESHVASEHASVHAGGSGSSSAVSSDRGADFPHQRAALIEIHRMWPGPDAPYLDARTQMDVAAARTPNSHATLAALGPRRCAAARAVTRGSRALVTVLAGAVEDAGTLT